jgi:hypothetical protein
MFQRFKIRTKKQHKIKLDDRFKKVLTDPRFQMSQGNHLDYFS